MKFKGSTASSSVILCFLALLYVAEAVVEWQLSYSPESLYADEWVNEGTLGSSYNMEALTGTLQKDSIQGRETDVLCFTSSDSKTFINYNINKNVVPDLTLQTWFKWTDDTKQPQWILSQDDGGWDRAIILNYNANNILGLGAGIGKSYTSTLGFLTVAEWTHIAVVYEDSQVTVYKNGGSAAGGSQQTISYSGSSSSHTHMSLNGNRYPGHSPVDGCFASVQVMNRALTAAEVAEEFATRLGTSEPTSPTSAPTPTMAPTAVPYRPFQVEAGGYHTCSVYGGDVKCWGLGNEGQLGLGNTGTYKNPQSSPVDLGASFDPIKVSCGYRKTCVVSSAGESKCFGRNDEGELGQGHSSDRGSGANQMGDNLPVINWGTDYWVEEMCSGYGHTCAMSANSVVKCVGRGNEGQLGYENTARLGDATSEMGDALPAVDLGDDFDAVQISCGAYFTCARSSEGDLKCWGQGGNGQLGQGDTQNRGDGSGEMGDSLFAIRLGDGFTASSVTTGWYHTCAVSTDNELKCWGENGNAQLGLGNTADRGNSAGTIPSNLPVVDLGTDFAVKEAAAGYYFTCATSTEGVMKCFGRNDYGQLGRGDKVNYIGDNTNELGDNLSPVLLGTGFSASGLHLPQSFGQHFGFAFEEAATGLLLKAWGYNGQGQAGYGDTTQRDTTGEMGDNLPLVALGYTLSPTAAPTASPTDDPTADPTVDPTADPTRDPTTDPTVEPTLAPTRCSEGEMTTVDWYQLYHSDGDVAADLLHEYDVDFDSSTYSLTLSATVEYVGKAADGQLEDTFDLGTTYWIDLQSFAGLTAGIGAAGSCGNRREADYDGLQFSELWDYTVDPLFLEDAPAAERMAYPPSDWTLSPSDESCHKVTYSRTLSLAELTACTDAEGEPLVKVRGVDSHILIEGAFFVELVSPYSMASSDWFRTYPLVQHEFELQLSRSANAMASSGVQLFVSSVMSFGHDDDGSYQMRVLVQSADFIELEASSVVTGPVAVTVVAEETDGCLVESSYICAQVFTVTIPSDIDCTLIRTSEIIDFSGTFQIAFRPKCRDNVDDAACNAFLDDLDESGDVVLDVDWNFVDETCGVDLFEVDFGANLQFYGDDQFSEVVADDNAYVVDQDTIYGQVELDLPATDAFYDLVDVEIENVFVCTAEVGWDLSATLDALGGLGGCLHSEVVSYYTVIGSGANAEFDGSTDYQVDEENIARFSFSADKMAFDTERSSIDVHVQLLLTLQTDSGRRLQRRMLLEDGDADSNQIRHFMGSTTVEQPAEEGLTAEEMVGISIGGVVVVAVVVLVAVLSMKRRQKGSGLQAQSEMAVHVSEMSPSDIGKSTAGAVHVNA